MMLAAKDSNPQDTRKKGHSRAFIHGMEEYHIKTAKEGLGLAYGGFYYHDSYKENNRRRRGLPMLGQAQSRILLV